MKQIYIDTVCTHPMLQAVIQIHATQRHYALFLQRSPWIHKYTVKLSTVFQSLKDSM